MNPIHRLLVPIFCLMYHRIYYLKLVRSCFFFLNLQNALHLVLQKKKKNKIDKEAIKKFLLIIFYFFFVWETNIIYRHFYLF